MYKIKSVIALVVFLIISLPLNARGRVIDITKPTVVLTVPSNGAVDVAVDQTPIIFFSERIKRSKVNNQVFLLFKEGSLEPIRGRRAYSKKLQRVTFYPKELLEINTQYTFRVNGDGTTNPNVKDIHGNKMESNYVWSFRTGPNLGSSTLSAQVSSTNPVNGAANVEINSKIIAIFTDTSGPINSNTAVFTLKQGTTPVAGTVSYLDKTATFTPTNDLTANAIYTATITTQVTDQNGNSFANDYVWSFTAGSSSDSISPTVQVVSPVDGSTNVATDISLGINFNEALDPSTVSTTTLILKQGATLIPATVTYYGTTATIDPSSNLATNTTYNVTITTQVTDLAGNPLANNFTWTFTTAASVVVDDNEQETVALGSTSPFVVLAGSTVTSTGPTLLDGDLGLSPGTPVTGFPPGTVSGTQHLNDPTAAQAKLDLTTAYNNAAARTQAPITVSGNLGGQTLTPGLYKSTSTLAISSGDLTLDAGNDPNAVFIFQIASAFTVTSGRQVILSGGAKASNIFWQVGSSASFGTSSVFKGNILADQSISFATGASLEGRALTRIGAVTLDSTTITRPAL